MKTTGHPLAGHRITVAYAGTTFFGWQRQAGQPSIQEEIEKVLARIWGRPITLEGSGRTDTGVHAVGQVASFTAPRKLPAPTLLRALNDHLPFPIRITRVDFLEPTFHARFDVRAKTYEYRIRNALFSDPFEIDRVWHIPIPLDLAKMEAAAALLRGKHDFAAMATNAGYARTTTVRTVSVLELRKRGEFLTVRITADGFLYHMVRNIVGALVKVGKGKLPVEEFRAVFAGGKRTLAPASAPAFGLYLMKVEYYPKAVRLVRALNRRPPQAFDTTDAAEDE